MNLEHFFSINILNELYDENLQNSRAKGIDKLNSLSFAKNKSAEISTINRKVLTGEYDFSPYIEVLKLKGRNSPPRLISIPTVRDRIVLLTIKEILHEIFSENVNRKLPNSYIRDIKKFISSNNEPKHFLKVDIEKFYDQIDQELLLRKLEKEGAEPRLISLIEKAITNPTVPSNTPKSKYDSLIPERGVPQGLSISNILAQIYLDELDNVIDRRKYFYRRYVDDIIILNSNVISNYRYRNIKTVLDDVNLKLNEAKTEKGSLANGFTFLSYKITDKKVSIAEKNIQIFIRRIAGKFTWFKNGCNDKNRRPEWLKENDRFKEVFIEELNEMITGIISEKKNYGWLFYFSEMNDESLLFKIDKIISKFFIPIDLFSHSSPKNLKSLVRTFKVIKHKGNKNYLANYDNYDSIKRKRDFLVFRGKIDPDIGYTDLQINTLFEKYRKKRISQVEKDIGYKYM